jgi:Contractile injection system tube protein
MQQTTTGELAKIYIKAYKGTDLLSPGPDKFIIPVNPDNFSQNLRVEYDTRRGHGDQGTDPRFDSSKPEELRLEFILDGTKTIEGYDKSMVNKSVKEQVELLLAVVYNLIGNIHRPNFLQVFWGDHLKFPCILSQLEINYTLFKEDGDPLRAKVNATFMNHRPPKEREARARKNSPDLTHRRQVKEGDRLDLMAWKIYDDLNFTLQVAKANRLTTIRNLVPGRELRFPPIDKNETTTTPTTPA